MGLFVTGNEYDASLLLKGYLKIRGFIFFISENHIVRIFNRLNL